MRPIREILHILIMMLALFSGAVGSHAKSKVALVIGNGDYVSVPHLENPENDARDISAALERIGFSVSVHLNTSKSNMSDLLRDFARTSALADVSLLYFAGHGFEIEKNNYVIPTDAEIGSALDVPYEAIEVDQLVHAVRGAKELRLVMLDACRNNPFLVNLSDNTRALSRGLQPIEPTGGVLVSFAARGGTVAYDGEGRNSPYAAAILQHIEEPGLEIGKLFRRIRDSVLSETEGKQEPFTYGSLPAKDLFLAPVPEFSGSENQIFQEFARAELLGTAMGWETFIARHGSNERVQDVVAIAHQKLDAARNRRLGLRQPDAVESALTRACDALAGDPADELLPPIVDGVDRDQIDAATAISACKAATTGHPNHGRSWYQLARAHDVVSGIESALPFYERASSLGYFAADIYLGRLHINKLIDAALTQTGLGHWESAYQNGSGRAAFLLGDYYSKPFRPGPPQGHMDYFLTGVERGDVSSHFQVGFRLLDNYNLSEGDISRAIDLLEYAASNGNLDAMRRLSSWYLTRGPNYDEGNGFRWLKAAGNEGDVGSISRLIARYSVEKDDPNVLKDITIWSIVSAENGHPNYAARAGYYLEIGRGAEVDPKRAAQFYFDSLAAGWPKVLQRRADDWDRETGRELQRLLRQSDKARYRGSIDGLIGGGTRAAMQRLCSCRRVITVRFASEF